MLIRKHKKIVIIGAGAQAKYIMDILCLRKDFKIIGIMKTSTSIDENFLKDLEGIAILNNMGELKEFIKKNNPKIIVALPNNREKEKAIEELTTIKPELVNIIHPNAIISRKAVIGKNVIINAGAVIQPYAIIGNGVMIHANVVVEHNCIIEDYVNLAPGVKLAGWVKVRRGSYIYTGASVIPCITIGKDSIIGAGSVVIEDVPERVLVVGNPAKIIKRLK
jgi:sugar O-acyltransferase (sialic acid O-acetyltransferase NeuD family)